MNKEEFVTYIASKNNCAKKVAYESLNMITASFIDAVAEHGSINLAGFGTFEVQKRKAREGRNPQTGAPMHIAEYNQPVFKAGKKMKDSCNPSIEVNKKH